VDHTADFGVAVDVDVAPLTHPSALASMGRDDPHREVTRQIRIEMGGRCIRDRRLLVARG
jgi:hypothetical protein